MRNVNYNSTHKSKAKEEESPDDNFHLTGPGQD
jgi:hypothetical protein